MEKKELGFPKKVLGLAYNQPGTTYNLIWLVLTVFISMYFSFILYPDIYLKITGSKVRLYVCTKNSAGTPIYVTNKNGAIKAFANSLYDNSFFYYSACDLLSFQERKDCLSFDNWIRVDPKSIGCVDVLSCYDNPFITVSKSEREEALLNINTLSGNTLVQKDRENLTLSDPTGWGSEAEVPLFFLLLFYGLKLGNLVKPYIFPEDRTPQQ